MVERVSFSQMRPSNAITNGNKKYPIAMFTPSPLTGAHINNQNWLPASSVPSKNNIQCFLSLPKVSLTNFDNERQPTVGKIIKNNPKTIITIRQANTSVPLSGCSHKLNKYSRPNKNCEIMPRKIP